ncbi:MAG: hypothetical protein LBS21_13870 [Clostridiales bacterium]|jgi:hypothetical protein|nr:hypothetical protein [Clostridiales bacterium]
MAINMIKYKECPNCHHKNAEELSKCEECGADIFFVSVKGEAVYGLTEIPNSSRINAEGTELYKLLNIFAWLNLIFCLTGSVVYVLFLILSKIAFTLSSVTLTIGIILGGTTLFVMLHSIKAILMSLPTKNRP